MTPCSVRCGRDQNERAAALVGIEGHGGGWLRDFDLAGGCVLDRLAAVPPRRDDRVAHGIHLRIEILLRRMRLQPCHRFTDAHAERFAALKIRDKSSDLGVVKDSGMGFVTL